MDNPKQTERDKALEALGNMYSDICSNLTIEHQFSAQTVSGPAKRKADFDWAKECYLTVREFITSAALQPSDMTLPELPDGVSYEELRFTPTDTWIVCLSLHRVEKRDYAFFKGHGRTPRSAALAAIEKIGA